MSKAALYSMLEVSRYEEEGVYLLKQVIRLTLGFFLNRKQVIQLTLCFVLNRKRVIQFRQNIKSKWHYV